MTDVHMASEALKFVRVWEIDTMARNSQNVADIHET